MSSEYREGVSDPRRREIAAALARAEAHIRAEGYAGWDPYDALTSPLLQLGVVRRSRLARFGAQQVLRRLPINLRPLLRIEKGLNPVTLGLVLEGYAALGEERLRGEARSLVERLRGLASPGYSGACWGYDFPWQSRSTLIPPYTPTVVATAFVTNGLFAAYERFGIDEAFELCASASAFVLRDLNRTPGPDATFCWSYSPLDTQAVLNATAKASRLCAQVGSVTGDQELAEAARQSVRYVASHQRADGAWPYAVGDSRTWVDNFHTGYVLDALDEWRRRTAERDLDGSIERGWRYYRANLFAPDGVPRYYDNRQYPIDATACGQALLTLSRFGDDETARRLAQWVVSRFQRPDGAFRYRAYRLGRNSIPYMRWSTAWVFAGLARVLSSWA
jgi:hypothetical protein